ncbi:D-alanyl-D-alanine carboxypeptidase/D-alanyl-D-alanine-endopeptidase [Bacillus sp. AFS029533]|uniref:D-alanyl-D-alanine carboxypeptidase/D-alanyl-D-alanine endopeptidase n=1 Tax=Bacillus sp. AFS029533 TaxID=2033494 RepID=UPI000BFC43C4|nr:D-alanyl-D-alanine carboxypeptidase/D-alanyl-D-alanine-endopeptidase [Bacillus sp. AFS029533]PGZ92135.1 peptidase S13 [Bacillus sp. AFS029533]
MKKMKRIGSKLLLSSALAMQVFVLPAYATSTETTSVVRTIPQIDSLVDKLSKSLNTIGMHAGIAVYNTRTGEILDEYDADKAFVPASNLKLFVAAAALDKLKPDYRFKTEVYTTGQINKQGVLHGDVIVKGYGDPSLSEEDMRNMAKELSKKSITSIRGDLLVDDSYYDDVRLGAGWMWDDESYGYNAQISALAVHENMISLSITPDDSIGETPSLEMNPINKYVTVQNNAKIVEGSNNKIVIDRPRGTNTIVISGTIGKQSSAYTEDVAIDDPALFAGNVWKNALSTEGIDITKTKVKIEKTKITTGTPILVHNSQPLSELIVQLNKQSDNFYAEMLLKEIGVVVKNEGSFTAGADVIEEFLKKAEIDTNYRQVDGSGLSRMDLISPKQMAQLLKYVSQQEYKDVFEQSLPIAGVDGTLKSRMIGTSAEKNVHAKTGSMTGVNSLSGYVTDQNGDKLAFSILLNGVRTSTSATAFQDAVAVLLSQYPNQTGEGVQSIADTFLLSTLIDPILDQENLKGVTTGIIVGSLDRKSGEEVLYQREADDLLTPASNMKLLTGATGLRELGPDYSFKTELYLNAPPNKHGKVDGDVIIKGYGDPTLQSEDPSGQQNGTKVAKLVEDLKKKGITQITGNILIDDSQYDFQRLGTGWAWDDETYGYNAQLSALSINRSSVLVNYQPSEVGKPVTFHLEPKTEYIQIINESKTVSADSSNTFIIEKERGKNIIYLKGDLPIGAHPNNEQIAVEEPSLYAGTIIKEEMEKAGIKLSKRAEVKTGLVTDGNEKISQLSSPPLSDILGYMTKNSDNFYAEMLLKRLGADKKGEGSSSAGAQVVKDSLLKFGIDPTYRMVDGSGLSRYDMLSARQIGSVLVGMSKEPYFDVYYQSLPIAGVDGTLKNRMVQTLAENNIHAKTGTLTGVSGLSGYVTTKDGEHLYFAILMNGYTSSSSILTEAQNKIGVALAGVSFK